MSRKRKSNPVTHGNVKRGSTYVQEFLLVRGTRTFTDRKKAKSKRACRQAIAY